MCDWLTSYFNVETTSIFNVENTSNFNVEDNRKFRSSKFFIHNKLNIDGDVFHMRCLSNKSYSKVILNCLNILSILREQISANVASIPRRHQSLSLLQTLESITSGSTFNVTSVFLSPRFRIPLEYIKLQKRKYMITDRSPSSHGGFSFSLK